MFGAAILSPPSPTGILIRMLRYLYANRVTRGFLVVKEKFSDCLESRKHMIHHRTESLMEARSPNRSRLNASGAMLGDSAGEWRGSCEQSRVSGTRNRHFPRHCPVMKITDEEQMTAPSLSESFDASADGGEIRDFGRVGSRTTVGSSRSCVRARALTR